MEKISKKELKNTLELHEMWLYEEEDGVKANLNHANLTNSNLREADLRYADLIDADFTNSNLNDADLRNANLRYATLRHADLTGADLTGADLTGADLDFSCLPLCSCGINFKIDKKIAKQLMYHVLNLMQYSNIEIPNSRKELIEFANESHRILDNDVKKSKEEGKK